MRTFAEIEADIERARAVSDVAALRSLATEMEGLGTPPAAAIAHGARGVAFALVGAYEEALATLGNALEEYEALHDAKGIGRMLGNMALVCTFKTDHVKALEYYRRALEIRDALGDELGKANDIGNIGIGYLSTGDYPKALEHFWRALAIHTAQGDQAGAARVTGNIGNVYRSTGDHEQARIHYAQAIAMHAAMGNRLGMARMTLNVGLTHLDADDFEQALVHFEQARATLEELGDMTGVVHAKTNAATALVRMGRVHEADNVLLDLTAQPPTDPGVRAQIHALQAARAECAEDLEAAHQHLLDAVRIATDAGLRSKAAEYHQFVRDLALKRNDFAGYVEHNDAYVRISQEIAGRETTQRLAMMEAERRLDHERLEREKERALLYGALPRSVADRLINGESVTGDHFDDAAVLFADIVDFTAHTSAMDATAVVELLHSVFAQLDEMCTRHQVIKVKTIGDSYLCFKGDASAHENATATVHVAQEILAAPLLWPGGEPLRLRLGIHSGPVTAGVIGSERLQYDIWGDTVNVASRMESSGEPGRIQVSSSFATALLNEAATGPATDDTVNGRTGGYVLTPRGEVEIKGKGRMNTFWLDA